MNNQKKQNDPTMDNSDVERLRQQSNLHGIPPSLLLSTGALAGTGSNEMDLKLVILRQQLLQQQQQELLARRQAEANLVASIQKQHLLSNDLSQGIPESYIMRNQNYDLSSLLAQGASQQQVSLEALAHQQRLMAIREVMSGQSSSTMPSIEELAAAQQLQHMQGLPKSNPGMLPLAAPGNTTTHGGNATPNDEEHLTTSKPPAVSEEAKALEPSIDPLHLQKQPFPEKLYYMLEEEEKRGNDTVLSYVADGTAFMIHKPREFEADVMPMYFSSTRMSSFQRQLNLYGFRRVEQGPFRGSYSHEDFRRGKKDLLSKIKRIPIKSRKKKNES